MLLSILPPSPLQAPDVSARGFFCAGPPANRARLPDEEKRQIRLSGASPIISLCGGGKKQPHEHDPEDRAGTASGSAFGRRASSSSVPTTSTARADGYAASL